MLVFIIFILCLFKIDQVQAFPENIRHGYVNCTTCHYSPTGGGLMTPYGRELSREVLSTWGQEGKEVRPLYGILDTPTWADWGGDFRAAQIYRDNPYVREARFIPMQFDLEFAAFYSSPPSTPGSPSPTKKITFVATAGVLSERQGGTVHYKPDSRRHYLQYHFNPSLGIRVGKFLRAFGLNVPDHIIATKRGLNFDQGSETYNAEISYIGPKLNLIVTGVLGRPDEDELERDKGGGIQASYALANRFRLGGNYFYGTHQKWQRNLWGIFGIFGFTSRLYLLSELDLQRYHPKSGSAALTGGRTHRWGQFTYQKLGYEWIKGFHTFLSFDQAETDLKESGTRTYSIGPGLLWYPRPHYEISLTWLKQKNPALSKNLTDFAFLMLHFYF